MVNMTSVANVGMVTLEISYAAWWIHYQVSFK